MAVSEASVKADRLPAATPAFGIDEAADVADCVDLPIRGFDAGLELLALIRAQDDRLLGVTFSQSDPYTRPVDRIDHETDEGKPRLVGQVHPENFKVTKPSFYAELIWISRTQRAKVTGKSVDWVVLRNRLQHIQSHNLQRVGAALDELARRVGYRVIPGLGERVIYRELFPKGLTLLDMAEIGEVGLGHIAARQELREMISGLAVPGQDEIDDTPKAAAAG